jgi:DNA (cytosine-5)-methyltransferase 1
MSTESRVAALFAGIGGIERGLAHAGFETSLFCEVDEAAQKVLETQFPSVPRISDVQELDSLPDVEVVTAGFPCQDLSQAGRKTGISGSQSSLVDHVFRLLHGMAQPPRWLVLENVSYMLHLDRGRAMDWLVTEIERLDMRWAYRVVDARSFGLPQRRQRVLLVASTTEDPQTVLFADDEGAADPALSLPATSEAKLALESIDADTTYGFYWTEGARGIGWTVDAVPPIKGGSRLGIPSPPAVWDPKRHFIGTPTLEDAEQLQGFPAGWTRPALLADRGARRRWVLVGNAVVPAMAAWLGSRLKQTGPAISPTSPLSVNASWPRAARGEAGRRWRVEASLYPLVEPRPHLSSFLSEELVPLSERATAGFQHRATTGKMRFPSSFLDDVQRHLDERRATLRGEDLDELAACTESAYRRELGHRRRVRSC